MKNEFYYKLLNIGKTNIDIEYKLNKIIKDVVKDAIKENEKLVGLCRVIATNIIYDLEQDRIDYRLINMLDYNLYDHVFILVRTMVDDKLQYYLVDPTFIQFTGYYPYDNLEMLDIKLLKKLITKGFCKIDNKDYNLYFKSFGYVGKDIDINDLFLEFKRRKK